MIVFPIFFSSKLEIVILFVQLDHNTIKILINFLIETNFHHQQNISFFLSLKINGTFPGKSSFYLLAEFLESELHSYNFTIYKSIIDFSCVMKNSMLQIIKHDIFFIIFFFNLK